MGCGAAAVALGLFAGAGVASAKGKCGEEASCASLIEKHVTVSDVTDTTASVRAVINTTENEETTYNVVAEKIECSGKEKCPRPHEETLATGKVPAGAERHAITVEPTELASHQNYALRVVATNASTKDSSKPTHFKTKGKTEEKAV